MARKLAPAGRRKAAAPSYTAPIYTAFRAAIERAGATDFCVPCYAYVLPGHTCPDWTLNLKPIILGTANLSGGLDAPEAA